MGTISCILNHLVYVGVGKLGGAFAPPLERRALSSFFLHCSKLFQSIHQIILVLNILFDFPLHY